MATKIWEVDFTSFSGGSNVLYDKVGSQPLTIFSGTSTPVAIPGFNNRQGLYFSNNNALQSYVIHGPGVPSVPNAQLRTPYDQRSFVLWIYPVNMYNSTYWDNANKVNGIWGAYDTTPTAQDGIFAMNYAAGNFYSIQAKINSGDYIDSSGPLTNNWHCVVLTVDRLSNNTKLYIDTVLIDSAAATPSSGSAAYEFIGDYNTANEGSYYLGQATTYSGVLSPAEITSIYNTFLADSVVGSTYYQTFSGHVYGIDGSAASGIPVCAYYPNLNSVVHSTLTSGDGSYQVILPYSGTYTVFAASGSVGAVAIPVVAASGGVYFP